MKPLSLTALVCLIWLGMANTIHASTPVFYECNDWKLEESVDGAAYIIVTQLKDYLANHRGKYQVIMALKGEIPVGAAVRAIAIPAMKTDSSDMQGGIDKGTYVLFMGQDFKKDGIYYDPDIFRCHGRSELHDRDEDGYSLLGYIANRLLHSQKALKIKGGMQ